MNTDLLDHFQSGRFTRYNPECYMGLRPIYRDENNHGGHEDHGTNSLKTNSVSSVVNDFRRNRRIPIAATTLRPERKPSMQNHQS